MTSISSLSDIRDKDNVQPLPHGLEFINKLKPVSFEWNQRDGGRIGIKDSGFIAQDLIQLEDEYNAHAHLQLTLRDNPDKYEATPGKLIPVLVKAIQELSAELETLKEQLNG